MLRHIQHLGSVHLSLLHSLCRGEGPIHQHWEMKLGSNVKKLQAQGSHRLAHLTFV